MTEKLETTTPGPDYTEQMQPHSFSDSAMEIAYLQGETRFRREDFRSGGVKVIHRLAKQAGRDDAELIEQWRERHAPRLVALLADRGLRKYEINLPCVIDVAEFRGNRAGTLFERASIDPPLGMEELWFDRLEDALRLGADPELRAALSSSYAGFVDVEKSYSLIAHERVVYDFVTPGEHTPQSAVLNPDSLEARVFKTGRPYHEPKFEDSTKRDGDSA